jgi:hypothetical protein
MPTSRRFAAAALLLSIAVSALLFDWPPVVIVAVAALSVVLSFVPRR